MALSLTLYETEMNVLLSLSDEQRGRILAAIICDIAEKEIPKLDTSDNAIFTLVNAQVKRAAELSSKRRQSVKSRFQPPQTDVENDNAQNEQENTSAIQIATKDIQNDTNPIQNDTNGIHNNHNLNHNQNHNDTPPTPQGRNAGGGKTEYRETFESFWAAYPKKTAKQQAVKAWQKLKPDKALIDVILSSLEQQKQSVQWTKDNGQFIPYPATWLNGRRWEDKLTGSSGSGNESSFDVDEIMRRSRKKYEGSGSMFESGFDANEVMEDIIRSYQNTPTDKEGSS